MDEETKEWTSSVVSLPSHYSVFMLSSLIMCLLSLFLSLTLKADQHRCAKQTGNSVLFTQTHSFTQTVLTAPLTNIVIALNAHPIRGTN